MQQETRLAALRAAMAEADLPALLLTSWANRTYASGFDGSAGWALVTPAQAWLVTDFRYVEQATAQAPAFTVVQARQQPEAVAQRLAEARVTAVGFEAEHVSFASHEKLATTLEGVQLRPVSGLVERLRQVKDAAELGAVERAVSIADAAWAHLCSTIRPGLRETDVAAELEAAMRRAGGSGIAFDTIVASGPRGSLPHGHPTGRVLGVGDLVTVDFGARCDDYVSDLTRTVCLGEATPRQREIYQLVLAANRAGVAAVRPGRTGAEVDAAARSVIAAAGLGDAFGHGLGHGIGLLVHEGPRLGAKSEDVLAPGMITTVEPGVYLPGWGGVRIEDDVVVTADGCRVLSRSPRELLVIAA